MFWSWRLALLSADTLDYNPVEMLGNLLHVAIGDVVVGLLVRLEEEHDHGLNYPSHCVVATQFDSEEQPKLNCSLCADKQKYHKCTGSSNMIRYFCLALVFLTIISSNIEQFDIADILFTHGLLTTSQSDSLNAEANVTPVFLLTLSSSM